VTFVHHEPPGPWVKAAYAALTSSLVFMAVIAVRVLHAPAVMHPTPGPAELVVPQLGERVTSQPWSAIRVVERDPFHPERTSPASRYLLPEDDVQATLPGASSVRGEVALLGTAVSGDGAGFVMCQFGRETPEVVRVGEEIGGLTLRSVTRGSAEFTRRDGSTVSCTLRARWPRQRRKAGDADPRGDVRGGRGPAHYAVRPRTRAAAC